MNSKGISIEFLKRMALKIYDAVSPLIGTQEGARGLKKGVGGDISMHIDVVAENIVIDALENSGIDIMLISEEIGVKYIGNEESAKRSQKKLIVDPIDGSTNSGRGIPFCSVSIAYAIGDILNDVCKAVIIDLTTKDIYWAEKEKGAFINGLPLKVSEGDENSDIIFEIDTDLKKLSYLFAKYQSIVSNLYKIRIMGSLALSLCLIAKGSIDGYLNLRGYTRIVDLAAGFLIIKEAGGKIFSMNGGDLKGELDLDSKIPLAASNAKLEQFLRNELMRIDSMGANSM